MIAHAVGVPRRAVNAVGLAVLVGLVGLAWWQTLADATRMPSMLDGLVRAGRAMPFDTSPARFVGMWIVMITAMMLPGFLPRRPTVAMASGYMAARVPIGAVAFGALSALNQVSQPTAELDRIGGAVLVFAGAYQLTAHKRRLLSYEVEQTASVPAPFMQGLSEGVRCIQSSWALMSVLLVVGVMNMAWMAAIGVVCLGEKVLASRVAFATAVGAALVVTGIVVVIYPAALQTLAGFG